MLAPRHIEPALTSCLWAIAIGIGVINTAAVGVIVTIGATGITITVIRLGCTCRYSVLAIIITTTTTDWHDSFPGTAQTWAVLGQSRGAGGSYNRIAASWGA